MPVCFFDPGQTLPFQPSLTGFAAAVVLAPAPWETVAPTYPTLVAHFSVQGKEYAIKVYKTSIMVFKDRDKYVSGEYRYRHGYCRSNPRKMVKVSNLAVYADGKRGAF